MTKSELTMNIGRKLKKQKQQMQFSNIDLTRALELETGKKIDAGYVSRILNGKQLPSLYTILQIAKVLQIPSLDELLREYLNEEVKTEYIQPSKTKTTLRKVKHKLEMSEKKLKETLFEIERIKTELEN